MLRYKIIPVTPFVQNATLLWCDNTNEAAVSDPGGDIAKILLAVKTQGVRLSTIFITHGHIDHAGGAVELSSATGAPIVGPHKDDQFWIDGLALQGRQYGFAGNPQPFTSSRYLVDGDTVKVGDETLQVIHCPGHTPGHLVFYHAPSKLAIVGDVLFQGSIGRTDFPRGNHADLIHSIRQKLFPLGDEIAFIPGHGPMGMFGEERAENPFVADWAVKS